MKYAKGFMWGVVIATIIAGLAVLFGWLFMMLWNWLIPELFNGPVLTFWQAVGLLILSKIIFGGFGHKRGSSHGGSKWKGKWNEKWSTKWEERCANMTDEDKERWKNQFMHKWNCTSEHKETEKVEGQDATDTIR